MDNQKQLIKLCVVCGNERLFNDYHRLYHPCKICVAKNSARHYQAKRGKIIARSKLYQDNTKKVKKSHSQQIEELNKKAEELTRVTETIVSKEI